MKRKRQAEGDSDASSEVSEEDLEEDEDEEELAFAEKCPPNCDMNMFDHVQMLRESRQDNVDEANEKKS